MAQQLMETPNVPLNFVPAKQGEVLHLGTIVIRIMEDGSRTGKIFFGQPPPPHHPLTLPNQTTASAPPNSPSRPELLAHHHM
jgi:hypothetical protein